ncbi:HoxN/HupN/NixA family nickel/cobalt transporter [Arthrobacter woluwensis]|uniref:HoxN/HupN/NixA family nickel/cobalt transporter n=1 Tax=Arthrobacter woluwensis TaxID=156980 RepID=UPI0015E68436|nr:hypothetical protein [Arthrobacter woluwensis]
MPAFSLAALHLIAVTGLWVSVQAGSGPLTAGLVLAYVLGIRHAFDADHIAIIDDSTRAALAKGRVLQNYGFYFAAGHSTIVFILAIAAAIFGTILIGEGSSDIATLGAHVGAVTGLIFIALVTALNIATLWGTLRLRREISSGEMRLEDVAETMSRRSGYARILGSSRLGRVGRKRWQLYVIGLLMGLGMESATEVSLIGMSATLGGSNIASVWVIAVCLPSSFAGGMMLFDSLDSMAMSHMYRWSSGRTETMLNVNVVMTSMTIAVSALILVVYGSELLVDAGIGDFLAPLASLSDSFETVGYAIAASFLLVWIVALAMVWRQNRRRNPPEAIGSQAGLEADSADNPVGEAVGQ